MKYIGIDLAWNPNNYSGVALLEDNKILYCDTKFIKQQLTILRNYLQKVLIGDFIESIEELQGEQVKIYEDKLDALVCAYTLYYCDKFPHKIYGKVFKVQFYKIFTANKV